MEAALDAFDKVRKPLASTVNILANALYEVFSSTALTDGADLQGACYDYFRLGEFAYAGPVSLLSGCATVLCVCVCVRARADSFLLSWWFGQLLSSEANSYRR